MHRLSQRQVILTWSGIAIVSVLIPIISYLLFSEVHPLIFPLESICLGFGGTIIIAIPSIASNLGKSSNIRTTREFSDNMHTAYEKLENDEVLSRANETNEYTAMMAFIYEHTDYDGDPDDISKKDNSQVLGDGIQVGSDTIDLAMYKIPIMMKLYSNRIDNTEEHEKEMQERRYVVLGCAVYGIAIVFQSLSAIISNLSSLGL